MESLGPEERNYRRSVSCRRRRRLARLCVPFCLGNTFVRHSFPNEFSTGFVDGVELPGVFGHVSMRLDISVKSMSKRFILGLAADGGDDKHPVTPNDRARHR